MAYAKYNGAGSKYQCRQSRMPNSANGTKVKANRESGKVADLV
jgi:hypothetical protein